MDSQTQRLIECFSAVFPGLSPEQILKASPETVEAWDSVAVVTLGLVIEEEFGKPLMLDRIEAPLSFEAIREQLSQ